MSFLKHIIESGKGAVDAFAGLPSKFQKCCNGLQCALLFFWFKLSLQDVKYNFNAAVGHHAGAIIQITGTAVDKQVLREVL